MGVVWVTVNCDVSPNEREVCTPRGCVLFQFFYASQSPTCTRQNCEEHEKRNTKKQKKKPTTSKDRTVLRARRLPALRRSRDDGRPSMISVPTILIRYLN